MRDIETFLSPDEDITFLARKHPSVLARPTALFIVGVVLGSTAGFMFNPKRGDDVIDYIAGGLVLLISLRLLAAIVRWRSEQIALTPKRLVVTHGLLKKEVTSIPLSRIRNITVTRSIGARLIRCGDVLVDIGDHGLIEITSIPRVKSFYRMLSEEMTDRGHAPTPRPDEEDTGQLPRVVL